ncbi:MAG: hypothetical protein IJ079_09190 [Lachnospiraceae bacterium]|nr:hypothetical protein [Lachnospiraceae bacterium]
MNNQEKIQKYNEPYNQNNIQTSNITNQHLQNLNTKLTEMIIKEERINTILSKINQKLTFLILWLILPTILLIIVLIIVLITFSNI